MSTVNSCLENCAVYIMGGRAGIMDEEVIRSGLARNLKLMKLNHLQINM